MEYSKLLRRLKIKILLLDIDYEVTEDGRVFSTKRKVRKELKQWFTTCGYPRTKVNNKSVPIHQLVASKFVAGYSETKNQVNHIDGNKLNNHYSNLEWVTHAENLHHAMDLGLHNWGRFPVVGINIKTYKNIYFDSIADAQRAGFTQANISHCLAGRRHSAGGYTWHKA